MSPVSVGGALTIGDYALWDKNPLRVRGDSVYGATHAAGGRSAYVGELPPFEAGADDVHLSILGTMFDDAARSADRRRDRRPRTSSRRRSATRRASPTATATTGRRRAARRRRSSRCATPPTRSATTRCRPSCSSGTSSRSTTIRPACTAPTAPQIAQIIEDYDGGLGELLDALDAKGLTASTNILFTLDHGKVDTHNQVALGHARRRQRRRSDGRGGDGAGGGDGPRHLELRAAQRGRRRADLRRSSPAPGPRTARRRRPTSPTSCWRCIQSGAITGLDTTRTLTADGALGTRSFHDFRAASPNQPDIVVFPQGRLDAEPGRRHQHGARPVPGAHAVSLRPPRRLLRRRALRPAHHGRAGVQERRDAAAPGAPPRGRAHRAGDARGARWRSRPPRAARSARRWPAIPGETIAVPADPHHRPRRRSSPAAGSRGRRAAATPPATNVIILDVAGLYDDELFDDATTADGGGRLPGARRRRGRGSRTAGPRAATGR